MMHPPKQAKQTGHFPHSAPMRLASQPRNTYHAALSHG
jgi:hypothetical protein